MNGHWKSQIRRLNRHYQSESGYTFYELYELMGFSNFNVNLVPNGTDRIYPQTHIYMMKMDSDNEGFYNINGDIGGYELRYLDENTPYTVTKCLLQGVATFSEIWLINPDVCGFDSSVLAHRKYKVRNDSVITYTNRFYDTLYTYEGGESDDYVFVNKRLGFNYYPINDTSKAISVEFEQFAEIAGLDGSVYDAITFSLDDVMYLTPTVTPSGTDLLYIYEYSVNYYNVTVTSLNQPIPTSGTYYLTVHNLQVSGAFPVGTVYSAQGKCEAHLTCSNIYKK